VRIRQKSREEVTGSLTIARTAAFVAFGLNLLFNYLRRPAEQSPLAEPSYRMPATEETSVRRGVEAPRTCDL
jgi:hypothetical protein